MRTWTPADRRAGLWSARGVVLVAVAYILTGLTWVVSGGSPAPQRLEPTDPYLAVLEGLIVLLAPILIVVMASVHAYAPTDRKTCTLVALALMTACAALTAAIHLVNLTVVRRLPEGDPRLAFTQLYPWPGLLLGLDLVAWDLFFGLALLFAAPAFRGDQLEAAIRGGLRLGGGLCLVGVLAQAVGNLWLQWPAILGYAFVFPAVCALLSVLFRRAGAVPNEAPRRTGAAGPASGGSPPAGAAPAA
jgi:hypothetical protein